MVWACQAVTGQVRRRAVSGDSTCSSTYHVLLITTGPRRTDAPQAYASAVALVVTLLKYFWVVNCFFPTSLRVPQHCPGHCSHRTFLSPHISPHNPAIKGDIPNTTGASGHSSYVMSPSVSVNSQAELIAKYF